MGYVTGGTFKKEIVELFGALTPETEESEPLSFDHMEEVGAELASLYELHCQYVLPQLCGLRWSYFFSIPDSYDADEEALAQEYEVAHDQIGLFMNTVEVFNDQGNPFFTVGDAGVCIAYDDPWEIDVWYEDFERFLQFLVQLSAAGKGKVELARVKSDFADVWKCAQGTLFLERTVKKAESIAQ